MAQVHSHHIRAVFQRLQVNFRHIVPGDHRGKVVGIRPYRYSSHADRPDKADILIAPVQSVHLLVLKAAVTHDDLLQLRHIPDPLLYPLRTLDFHAGEVNFLRIAEKASVPEENFPGLPLREGLRFLRLRRFRRCGGLRLRSLRHLHRLAPLGPIHRNRTPAPHPIDHHAYRRGHRQHQERHRQIPFSLHHTTPLLSANSGLCNRILLCLENPAMSRVSERNRPIWLFKHLIFT